MTRSLTQLRVCSKAFRPPYLENRSAMAQVTYTGTTEAAGIRGKLFHNIRFWVSQKVPQRSRFIDDIKVRKLTSVTRQLRATNTFKSNGGEVYPLEKQASVLIVDHARKEALPGTYVPSRLSNFCSV